MAIDFSFPPEVEEVRQRVREFLTNDVKPRESALDGDRSFVGGVRVGAVF